MAACGTPEAPVRSVQLPEPASVPRAVSVLVTFDSTFIRAGGRVQATAIPLDAAGVPMEGRGAATWSVEGSPGLVTISSSGLITTLAPGVAVIVATIDGVRGEEALVVRPLPALAQVVVSLDSAAIWPGSTTQARAVQQDSVGDAVAPDPVSWRIEGDPAVATVSTSGLVTALTPGTIVVQASVKGITGEATLEVITPPVVPPTVRPVHRVTVTLDASVLPLGASTQARFEARDSSGVALGGKSIVWSTASGSAAATVSASGVVTAIGVGPATIQGTVDGVTGSAALTVNDTTTAALPAPVRLPDALRDSVVVSYPVVTGRTLVVRDGQNLQAALDSARRGDEVVLQAGAVFTGTFTLPAKSGTVADGWILVRSDRQGALPTFGTRVTPAHAALMPQLATDSPAAVLQTAAGASGWWITGIELTIVPTFTKINYGLVLLGDGSGRQHSLSAVPSEIVLDRVYVHARPTVGTSRCVALNSARTAIVGSYLDDCHLKGYDSQAIAGWNGPGPFLIENNALHGAGENVMFGGSDPSVPGLIPSDIIVRRNHVYTPLAWKGGWTKKNLLETKNVQRLLVEENVFDGSWGDAQVGYAFVLKSANQSGRCTWCASRDITFRYNLIRNVGAGFNLAGREGSNPHPVGERMTRVLIEHNVMEEIMIPPFTGDGRIIQLLQNLSQLTIRNNSFTTTSSTLGQFLNIGRFPAATGVSFTRNIVSRGLHGMFASASGEGAGSLDNIAAPVQFSDVVVISAQRPRNYPAGTIFVSALSEAQVMPGYGADEPRVRAVARLVVIP